MAAKSNSLHTNSSLSPYIIRVIYYEPKCLYYRKKFPQTNLSVYYYTLAKSWFRHKKQNTSPIHVVKNMVRGWSLEGWLREHSQFGWDGRSLLGELSKGLPYMYHKVFCLVLFLNCFEIVWQFFRIFLFLIGLNLIQIPESLN